MKKNSGFRNWSGAYLFQGLEDSLSRLSPAEKKEIIPLAVGDPDLVTPAGIREAMIKSMRDKYFGYPSVAGTLELRETLAAYYLTRFKVVIEPEDILIGPGAKTDLFDLCAVFAERGHQVAILDPAYPVYRDAAVFRELEIIYLEGDPDNHYQPEFDESRIRSNLLDLIFMCYPNNPTGAVASKSYAQSMIHTALRQDALIIYDVAYADFVPGNKPSSAFSIFSCDEADKVAIEVGSFSKPYSMTNDRISWVVIRNKEIRDLWRRYRSNRDSGVSTHLQAGAVAALTDQAVQEQVRSNMIIYGRRADLLRTGLMDAGIRVAGLDNSPYAWFRSPISDSTKTARILLENARIQVTPGIGFGPAGEHFLRATIFQSQDRIAEAISRFLKIDFSLYS
jgi:LL-diaminopimelate aminotransferase